MRVILRIVAFLTMLLALVEAVLVTIVLFNEDDKFAVPHSFVDSLNRTCHLYGGAATLFCSGAMLYLLIRISVTQEDDVRTQTFVNAASERRQP